MNSVAIHIEKKLSNRAIPRALAVYLYLVQQGQNGDCQLSYQDIGDACFANEKIAPASRRRRAIRAINDLEQIGLVEKTVDSDSNSGQANSYTLLWPFAGEFIYEEDLVTHVTTDVEACPSFLSMTLGEYMASLASDSEASDKSSIYKSNIKSPENLKSLDSDHKGHNGASTEKSGENASAFSPVGDQPKRKVNTEYTDECRWYRKILQRNPPRFLYSEVARIVASRPRDGQFLHRCYRAFNRRGGGGMVGKRPDLQSPWEWLYWYEQGVIPPDPLDEWVEYSELQNDGTVARYKLNIASGDKHLIM